jgi:hypothetical protein
VSTTADDRGVAVICPRCAWETAHQLASSPVPDVWQVWQCERCLYTWRTSEPDRRTRRSAYPERFRITRADIDAASEMPAVPPLRSGA